LKRKKLKLTFVIIKKSIEGFIVCINWGGNFELFGHYNWNDNVKIIMLGKCIESIVKRGHKHAIIGIKKVLGPNANYKQSQMWLHIATWTMKIILI
jgi:hypothetical protein